MQTTILVLGGTGLLGQPVCHSLQRAGFLVRIMTRDPARATQCLGDSFEIVAGSATDSGSLGPAMEGCGGVHISLPSQIEQGVAEAVAQLAPGHGIERITYISGATVSEERRWFPMVDRKYLAEQAIRQGSVPSTIFCPTWFMESLPLFVVRGRATVLGKQPCLYHWIAADDYAAMVARAYTLAGTESQRLILHGPQAIAMHEALRRYCGVLRPDITKVSTMPLWLVRLVANLSRNHELGSVAEMMAYFERVGEGHSRPTVDSRLGRPTTTLDQWLEQRRAGRSVSDPAHVDRPHSYA